MAIEIFSATYLPSQQTIIIEFAHPTREGFKWSVSVLLTNIIEAYFPQIEINQLTVKDGWEICKLIKQHDLMLTDNNGSNLAFKLVKKKRGPN